MIASIKTNAYHTFSTIAAKIQATSFWSQLPAKSAVATAASKVLFSKYTHAVIGVGIFCGLMQHAYSNHINYINTPTYKEYINNPRLLASIETTKDENGKDRKTVRIPEDPIMDGHVSALMPHILIATAVLCATLARVILLP